MTSNEIINQISIELRNNTIKSPSQWAENHRTLAGWYAFLSDELINLSCQRDIAIIELRKSVKSDTQAERQYDSSVAGNIFLKTKTKLKIIEKLLSSLKLTIEVEKNNLFNSSNKY